MKSILSLSLAVVLGAIATAPAAAAGKGVGVRDLGKDGDIRYHEITCQDQRTLILEVDYEKRQTCFPQNDGKQQCLKDDDIRAAGERACRATQP